jgi:zinc protease
MTSLRKNPWKTPSRGLALVSLLLLGPLWSCASTPATPAVANPATPTVATAEAVASSTKPQTPTEPPIPLDARVKQGKLDNGLTYYILPHEKPEKRAYFWLAVNAGSVLEADDQQGLAHFLEHMGFNGTRRFPKQEIVNFIEKAGMKFGAHLNAYTSFDETVYMLQVPTDDNAALTDKALQVLHDWADGVSMVASEIDKERGVVLEEWRLGRGAGMRLFEKQAPVLFHGSAYAKRLPIGKPEIIKGAPREALARFYKDWYRPDLMAVIAVGDFKPAEIEQKIRQEFGVIPKPASPKPRPVVTLPKHEETLVSIETDPEMPSTVVSIRNKMAHRSESSPSDFRRMLAEQLYHMMLNARLDEIRRKPDAPFLGAGSGTASMVRSADVFAMQAQAREGQAEKATAALLEELLRVERHGFTATELERAKKGIMRQAQQAVLERDKRDGQSFASELVRYYLEGETMPGPEGELALTKKFLPTFSAEELSQLAKVWVGEGSRVVSIAGPANAKVTMPTKESIAAVVAAVEKSQIAAYKDTVSDSPLVDKAPKPGKVVAEKTIPEIGVTEWKLSSGARVIVKPTNFKNDEVSLWGFSPGGTSLVKDADYDAARFASAIMQQSGVGSMDAVSLRKALAGKIASADAFVGELEEGVRAGSSPEDLKTMFELLYLSMTAPRKDEGAFASWQARESERARNRRLSPEGSFFEDLGLFLSQNHRRRQPTTPEVIEKVKLDRAFELYKQRFADSSDFTYVIVGNVDLPTLKPLVETYIGGLPAGKRKEKWKDIGVKWPRGPVEKVFTKGQEPKSQVMIAFHGPAKYTKEADDDLDLLGEVLNIRLREVLREELGGVYGVGAGGGINRRPREEYTFTVQFGCAPDNVEKLKGKVMEEITAIQKEGVKPEYLEKIKQARRRAHEVNLKENGFWGGELANAYRYGEDPRKIPEIDKWVNRIDSNLLKTAANKYLKTQTAIAGILKPEAGAEKVAEKVADKSAEKPAEKPGAPASAPARAPAPSPSGAAAPAAQ